MLYDTHAHPYLNNQKKMGEILSRFFGDCPKNKLNAIATDFDDIPKVLELANNYQNIFATIGIHPSSVTYDMNTDELQFFLRDLYLKNTKKIVAIGECGLDYFHLEYQSKKNNLSKSTMIKKQKDIFLSQIQLAQELKIPFIIHNRNSGEDMLEILKDSGAKNFVFHSYTEDFIYAKKILSFAPDAKFGFGGIMTFKNAQGVQDAAKNLPLQNIIIETDEPFLTPTPLRGKEENEPLFLKYILDFLADLRSEDKDFLEKKVYQNAVNFFEKK